MQRRLAKSDDRLRHHHIHPERPVSTIAAGVGDSARPNHRDHAVNRSSSGTTTPARSARCCRHQPRGSSCVRSPDRSTSTVHAPNPAAALVAHRRLAVVVRREDPRSLARACLLTHGATAAGGMCTNSTSAQ